MVTYNILHMFEPNSIAFALITFYPKWYKGKLKKISHTDKIRGDLALEFIKKAIVKNYQVIVVDGNNPKNYREELIKLKEKIKIINRKSLQSSSAKRQAFIAASRLSNVKVIIATEPEKTSLIDSIPAITTPILEEKADIVVAKRNNKLFQQSFPDYMYYSETEGNRLYNKQLKLHILLSNQDDELDMFFGPRAFANTSKNLKLFTRNYLNSVKNIPQKAFFDPERYSNAIFFPIVAALKEGLRVISVEIPFIYPESQKINENVGAKEFFVEKRRIQKSSILLELKYLLRNLK